MKFIFQIYNLFFYKPIFGFLFFLYNFFGDFGLAIVFLTLIVRLFLFPFVFQSSKIQEKITNLQKELKEIEEKYNGEEKAKKTLELYRKAKINPFFGFVSLFVQLPILIALYQVFLKGIRETSINPLFLGFFDLSKPNLFLALFVAFFQFFYSKVQNSKKGSKGDFIDLFQNQFNLFLSFFTFLILLKLPSAIGLYLIINFLFLIFQKRYFHA